MTKEELIEEIADCFSGGNLSYNAGQIRTILDLYAMEFLKEYYFECEESIFREYKLALKNKRADEANAFAQSLAMIKEVYNNANNKLNK